jgi:hypothetical protein
MCTGPDDGELGHPLPTQRITVERVWDARLLLMQNPGRGCAAGVLVFVRTPHIEE